MKPIKDLKSEIKDCLIMILGMLSGMAVLLIYRDYLPLYLIILLGFWYPIGIGIRYVYRAMNKDGDSL